MDQLEEFKELLSEPKNRIRLHDFMAGVTKTLVEAAGQDKFAMQGPTDVALRIGRLQAYEETIQRQLPLQMLFGRWGLPDHVESACLPLRRLAGAISATAGNSFLIEARWYPVLLLLYASCIGAIPGHNYQLIHRLFHMAVPNDFGRKNRDILLISVLGAVGEINDSFKLFPGLERKHTPRSEHVFGLLQPYADDTLYSGSDYEEFFDRAEVIMSIEYMHIEHPESVGADETAWGPVGRFAWKRSLRNPLDRIVAEASVEGKNWEPARAGLFGGSSARFIELAEGLSRGLNQVSW